MEYRDVRDICPVECPGPLTLGKDVSLENLLYIAPFCSTGCTASMCCMVRQLQYIQCCSREWFDYRSRDCMQSRRGLRIKNIVCQKSKMCHK